MADAADYANRVYFASRRDDADPSAYTYRFDGSVREEVRTPYTANGTQEVHTRLYDEQQLPVQVLWKEYDDMNEYIADVPRLSQTYYYRYSGSGQRVWESAQGQVRRTVRGASGEALAVFDGSGNLVHWNMSGGLGRMYASGLKYYYLRDHLGSVRAVVRADLGSVVEARDYYAFGMEMAGRSYVSGTRTKESYTGHERDAETGLLYAGARYYDSATGRWLVVDPLAEKYPAWSPYNYVLGNPLSLIDPDGMAPDPPNWTRFWQGTRTLAAAVWQSSVGVIEMAASPGAGPAAPIVLGAGTVALAHGVPSAGTALADMVLGLKGEEGPGSGGVFEFVAREAGAASDVIEMAKAGDTLIGFIGGNPLKVVEIPSMLRSLPTSAREARRLTGTAQKIWFEIVETAASNSIDVYGLLNYVRQSILQDEPQNRSE